jgi:DCN1-like protein 4/5
MFSITSQLFRISSLHCLAITLRDLEDLLLLGKPPLKPLAAAPQKKKPTPEPYNRSRYYLYAADKPKAFNELYLFCFMLAKPP